MSARSGRLKEFGQAFAFVGVTSSLLARASETAGVVFSPDGERLFLNVQTPGITLAITGPWHRGAL